MIIQKARSFPNYTPATLMPSPTISQSRSNAYQNLSKLCQNLFLPSCFRIILFLFILLPHCIIVGVVFFNMQTNFSQNMHTHTDWHTARQSLGNSSYLLPFRLGYWRNTSHPSGYDPLFSSLLFLREYFIYIQQGALSSSFSLSRYRVSIMFHFTHISPLRGLLIFHSTLAFDRLRKPLFLLFTKKWFFFAATSAAHRQESSGFVVPYNISSKRFLIAG